MLGPGEREEIGARLEFFAWHWYRIRGDVAEDIAQAAQLTYLEVRGRYAGEEERPDLLLGILRNKCREHIAKSVRASRALRGLRSAAQAGEAGIPVLPAAPKGDVLGELVRREDGSLILDALAQVRPRAREMFRLIAHGATRQDLIKRYAVNKNTLDSRLHSYRGELREALAERGVPI